MQALMIQADERLKQDPGDDMKVLNIKLHENLGAIKYIFSDKTGTLTRNEMYFHSCSIFGLRYDHLNPIKSSEGEENHTDCNGAGENLNENSYFIHDSVKKKLLYHLKSEELIENFDVRNPFKFRKQAIMEFLLGICLNHSVIPEKVETTNEFSYSGPSPDEVTIVSIANEIGFSFIGLTSDCLTVSIGDQLYQYQILKKIDYTSERKRSSIIVRCPDNSIKLFMKGADSVVLKKIDNFSLVNLYKPTTKDLEYFSENGLRIFCYTVRAMSHEEYDLWEKAYEEMIYEAISNKAMRKNVETIIDEIENNSLLLGVTALEDKLQDNVGEVLSSFIDAGISTWMLTGDKLDTAESIGYSCKLFNDDTEVFKIKELSSSIEEDILNEIKKCKLVLLNLY